MRPEIEFRKPWLAAWPGLATLVEPSIGSTPGAPDTHLAYRGFGLHVEGWLEFKVPDERGRFEIRPKQRLWHLQALEHTSNVAFCVLNDQAFWLVPSRMALLQASVVNAPVRGVMLQTLKEATAPTFLPGLVSAAFDANERE